MANVFDASEWLDMMSDTVDVYPYLSQSVSGVPTYASLPTTYPAYIEMKNHRVIDAIGREVMAKGKVFLGTLPGDQLSYAAATKALGPIGYWPLNDAGPVYKDLAFGGNGVASGPVTARQPGFFVDGSLGASFDSTGTLSPYISIPAGSPRSTLVGDVTLEGWCQLPSIPPTLVNGGIQIIASMKWNSQPALSGVIMLGASWIPASSSQTGVGFWYLFCDFVVNGTPTEINTTDPTFDFPVFNVPVGIPIYVAFTLSGGVANIYVNELLVASITAAGSLDSSDGSMVIGNMISNLSPSNGWNGTLQNIALYNYAFGPSLIIDRYARRAVNSTIGVRDRVILPPEYVPVSPPIISVDIANDENGNHHIVLHIGGA